jgi:hypothetical protein
MAYVRTSALLMLAAMIGCGGSGVDKDTVPVTGIVTQGGAPLGDVSLVFTPKDGGRQGTAYVGPDGKFTSATSWENGDGLIPGEHTVTFNKSGALLEDAADGSGGAQGGTEGLDPKAEAADSLDIPAPEGQEITVTIKSGDTAPLEIKF